MTVVVCRFRLYSRRCAVGGQRPVITRIEEPGGALVEEGGNAQETAVIVPGAANEVMLDILDDNDPVAVVQVQEGHCWTMCLSGLAVGLHRITAKNQLDGQVSEPWSFTVKSVENILEITRVLDSQGREVSNGGDTQDRNFTVSGTANSNVFLLFYDGDDSLHELQAGELGDWQTSLKNLPSGMHSFKVKETISAVESEPWVIIITADDVKPVITRVEDLRGNPIENGGNTQETIVTLFGTANDSIVDIWDEEAWWGSTEVETDNTWNKRLAGLEVRTHKFTAVNEVDGQRSDPWIFTVSSAEVAPEISRVQDSKGQDIANGGVTADTQIELSGTATKNSRVEIFEALNPEVSWGTVPVSLSGIWAKILAGLNVGLHPFKARDMNSQMESESWALTVIAEEPLVIDTSPMRLDGFSIYTPWPRTDNDSPGNTQVRRPTGGNGPYSYSSSNIDIAQVDSSGKVRGVGWGETTIVVRDQKTNVVSFPVIVTNVYEIRHSPYKYTHPQAVDYLESYGPKFRAYDQRSHDEMVRLYQKPFPYLDYHYWCPVRDGCGGGLALSFFYPQQELGCADPNLEYEVILLAERGTTVESDARLFGG